ncbi:hypothetical protein OAL01_03380 [Rubripirellula sp.]|nr:hypothetical protein [Rubripirellula sp.]
MKTFREYIQQTTNDGASSHEGLYWVDPKGESFLVNNSSLDRDTKLSHEDWANKNGFSLEEMFEAGWIRVQALPPQYLMIDHKTVRLGRRQAVSLYPFFTDRYHRIILDRGDNKLFDLNKSPNYVSDEVKEQGFDFISGKTASPTRCME